MLNVMRLLLLWTGDIEIDLFLACEQFSLQPVHLMFIQAVNLVTAMTRTPITFTHTHSENPIHPIHNNWIHKMHSCIVGRVRKAPK